MSSSIDNLPNSTEEQIDPDVDNILNSLQNEYEDNNNELNHDILDNQNNYINNNNDYNQNFNEDNQVIIDNTETNNVSNSLFDNILGKCKEPLIVLIVVFLINNNFTLSVLKNIPQLSTEGVLNMVGYGAVAIIIAITFFVLNIVSTQFI